MPRGSTAVAERQFGPYRLVRQIAVGGMAEIHLAKTAGIAGFEKYVAIKMIHPNFAEDEQFIQMLVDEAKIASVLRHGSIARVYEFARAHGEYFITVDPHRWSQDDIRQAYEAALALEAR